MPAIASFAAALAIASSLQGPTRIPPIPSDREPVVTTASGLKYCVLKQGEGGASPKFGDVVKVHYTGWNTDGSVFDSSRNGPKPAEFALGDVIEGWNEALLMMTPGAHWKLTIPPELGYGLRGMPPQIKSNATLIFEVELIAFEKGPDLPPFHPADPARQKRSESGIVYEPIVEGSGKAAHRDDVIEIRFAIWNQGGRLLVCTEKLPGPTRGRAADFKMRFLQLAPQFLTTGARYRFEVPAELCAGLQYFGSTLLPSGSTTIWEVELVKVLAAFAQPDAAKGGRTPSGLVYEVLKEGDGESPRSGDDVTVHYAGWLTDGTLFDSSYTRGRPMTLSLAPGGLIPGWLEGLPMMKEGAIWRFLIPASLAYGEKGQGKIPPDSPLLFQIELEKVGRR